MVDDGLQLWSDPSPARWVVDRIHDFSVDVGSVIPEGFDSYVRVFHPASRIEQRGEVVVRWSEVAAAYGRTAHREMQWPHISGVREHSGESSEGLWDHEPELGSLPRREADLLGQLLAPHTSTPDRVWFCIWEGCGGLEIPRLAARLPSSTHPRAGRGRPGILVFLVRPRSVCQAGTTACSEAGRRMPTRRLWLRRSGKRRACGGPTTRAWFVATEIDFSWTYIGGTETSVRAVLEAPDLEAMPIRISDGIAYDSDRINPRPPTEGG